jgi:hypothetical protein
MKVGINPRGCRWYLCQLRREPYWPVARADLMVFGICCAVPPSGQASRTVLTIRATASALRAAMPGVITANPSAKF